MKFDAHKLAFVRMACAVAAMTCVTLLDSAN
jgi:hypothetical protein